MSRRNRKKRVEGFAIPVPFAGLVVLVATLGLMYVWLGCRGDALGGELKKLEAQIAEAQKVLSNEQLKWAAMKSPQGLEGSLKRFRLAMARPRPDQIVRLDETDVPERQLADTGRSLPGRSRHERLVMNE